jgi:predicted amino acid-binding ACT domain protein
VNPTTNLVLVLIGPDRPGLVEAVSDAVARHGGNWLESRMARLAGQFAGILRVAVPETARTALEAELGALQQRGLRIVVEASAAEAAPGAGIAPARSGARGSRSTRHRAGDLAGARPARRQRRGVVTECVSAPMSGELLFRARRACARRSRWRSVTSRRRSRWSPTT